MAKAIQPQAHSLISAGDLYEVVDSLTSEYDDAADGDDRDLGLEAEEYPLVREPGYHNARRRTFETRGFDDGADSDDWLQAEAEERLWNTH